MKVIIEQIEKYLNYCEKVRGMTPATLTSKRNVLYRFAAVTEVQRLEALSNGDFETWVEKEMMDGVSARSINMYNAVVIAMVRYYRGVGMKVPVNLALVGKLKEGRLERKFYSAEEIKRVITVADEVDGLIIGIMFETGMRIAEVARLKVGDFDGRRVSFIGKGRKPREVYVREDTLKKIMRYVRKYQLNGYLWCVNDGVVALNGEPPTVNTIRIRLRRVFAAAGYRGFYPHALRHSFATDLQLRGASVAEIKEMIGHENIATTERYLHGFEGRMQELFDKYRG